MDPFYAVRFTSLISLYIPRKRQKTRGFLIFSWRIVRDPWHEHCVKCVQIRSFFSPNAGKYGTEKKLRIWTIFKQWKWVNMIPLKREKRKNKKYSGLPYAVISCEIMCYKFTTDSVLWKVIITRRGIFITLLNTYDGAFCENM